MRKHGKIKLNRLERMMQRLMVWSIEQTDSKTMVAVFLFLVACLWFAGVMMK